jgi:hydrogenase nickel incorporation protein HypA/HybF
MHELPVTKSIVKISSEEAEKHNAKIVKEIRIKVGVLTGLIPDSIQYYFDIISKGTLVEGAGLKIEKLPIRFRCNDCGCEDEAKAGIYSCKNCESMNIKIIGGNEFFIESLEIE